MRETRFIDQNKEKWKRFEQILATNDNNPDKLSELFIEVTDDLSYAKTFYGNRSVSMYLNGLAQKISQKLSSVKYSNKNRFVYFWTDELPTSVYIARKALLISLCVFTLSMLIGVLSSVYDVSFVKTILGDAYVEMTLENIKKNDPMAVYKKANEVDMFIGITLNNVLVAFFTFILGIFSSIGSMFFLLYHGIMLGSFQYFFYQKGLLATSALTIWQHGTLEISAIIIAGGAGITLGNGLLFPGTYSRVQSFFISAQSGIRILMGTVPIFIIAGFIEGFYTRLTDAPIYIRLFTIIASLAFIVWYFIWLPFQKAKKIDQHTMDFEKIFERESSPIEITTVKKTADILTDTFTIYFRNIKTHFFTAVIASILISLIIIGFIEEFEYNNFEFTRDFGFFKYFNFDDYAVLYPVVTLLFSFVILHSFILSFKDINYTTVIAPWSSTPTKTRFIRMFVGLILLESSMSILLFQNWFSSLLFIILFPIVLVFCYSYFIEGTHFFKHVTILSSSISSVLIISSISIILGLIFYGLTFTPLVAFYNEIIQVNFTGDSETMTLIYNFSKVFVELLAVFLIIPVFGINAVIIFFNTKEKLESNGLKIKLEDFFK